MTAGKKCKWLTGYRLQHLEHVSVVLADLVDLSGAGSVLQGVLTGATASQHMLGCYTCCLLDVLGVRVVRKGNNTIQYKYASYELDFLYHLMSLVPIGAVASTSDWHTRHGIHLSQYPIGDRLGKKEVHILRMYFNKAV